MIAASLSLHRQFHQVRRPKDENDLEIIRANHHGGKGLLRKDTTGATRRKYMYIYTPRIGENRTIICRHVLESQLRLPPSTNLCLQITCPGVWLCPNGKVALRITSFGSTLESHRVSPIFPLLFHNEFNFKKTFTRLAALTELQRNLERQSLYAELLQWLSPCNQPVLLATFQTTLTDLLYPMADHCGRLLPGFDVDLLMDPSKYFPVGIFPSL